MGYYVGILDGSRKVWGVRFPDFPGCHGGGPTPDAAIADATSALRVFAAMMVADDEPIPRSRTLEELEPDERPGKGESLVMIPLLLDKARPVRANISIDAGLLEAIDEEAKRRGLTRSAFLISAALDKIEGTGCVGHGSHLSSDGGSTDTSYHAAGFAEPRSARTPLRSRRKARRR